MGISLGELAEGRPIWAVAPGLKFANHAHHETFASPRAKAPFQFDLERGQCRTSATLHDKPIDVHRNSGRNAATIPFVVVVQSAAFDKRKRRIVVPLVAADRVRPPPSAVNPVFSVMGLEVTLNPLEIASVAVESLGEPVGTLVDAGDAIVAALAEVFSRAWG